MSCLACENPCNCAVLLSAQSVLSPSPVTADSEILEYLARHPQAQDTVEGIAEWWILEQRVHASSAEVRAALDRLVARGLVSAQSSQDGRVFYRASLGGASPCFGIGPVTKE